MNQMIYLFSEKKKRAVPYEEDPYFDPDFVSSKDDLDDRVLINI